MGQRKGYKQTPEHIANRIAASITHGATRNRMRTREYLAWCDMKTRCRRAALYKQKGITICRAWASFETFLRDMGRCPPGLTLERVNNNGNYTPRNCKWATRKEQSLNTSRTRWITYKGETLCLADWARRLRVSGTTVSNRLARTGSMDKPVPRRGYKQTPEHIAKRIKRKRLGE